MVDARRKICRSFPAWDVAAIRRGARQITGFASARSLGWLLIALVALLGEPQSSATALLELKQLEHRTWGSAEGAPANCIGLVEDDAGLLWLTSPSGVFTFDGKRFVRFQFPDQVDPAQTVLFSLRSVPGAVWGTSRLKGVVRIDAQHRVTAYGEREGLPPRPVTNLRVDREGGAWALVNQSLHRLDNNRWHDVTQQLALPRGQVQTYMFDKAGVQWVATQGGLFYRAVGEQRFQESAEHWANEGMPLGLYEDPRGALWVQLYAQNPLRTLFRQVTVPGRPRWFSGSIALPYAAASAGFDKSGSMWISGNGLDRVDFSDTASPGQTADVTAHTEHFGAAQGLSSDSARELLTDNEGDQWVATMRGLDRFRRPDLVKATTPTLDGATLPDLAPGLNGNVWLAGGGQSLYRAKGAASASVGPVVSSVLCLFQDREGDVWFNSGRSLVHLHDGKSMDLPPPPGLLAAQLRQVVELPDQSLLFSFYAHGVWKLAAGSWLKSTLGQASGEVPTVLSVDSRGVLWAGYPSGRVTVGNGSAEHELVQPARTLGAIAGFYESALGMLVSGQRGMAVSHGPRLVRLRFADDQLSLNVTGIVQSDDRTFWLNGQEGVARVEYGQIQQALAHPETSLIEGRLLRESDLHGPAPFFYDLPTAAKDATDRLWFNTSGALVYIDPRELSARPHAPIVSINSSVRADDLALRPGEQIPPRTQTVRIQYYGSQLTAPEDVQYRYRLSGVDEHWQLVEDRTEAVYTRLRPGKYSFEVSATAGGSIWTPPQVFNFEVLPAFYQTWKFKLLCGFLLLAGIALMMQLRIKLVVRRIQERAGERTEERVRIARDLHDTLLQGLQGLMLQFHVASAQLPEGGKLRGQIQAALRSADKVMVDGRNHISRLRADDLGSLPLREAIMRLHHDISAEFASPPACVVHEKYEELALNRVIKAELYWIAREALLNTCRHGQASEVAFLLEYERRAFRLSCRDNGCGMSDGMLAAGGRPGHFGLTGMQERARKVGAALQCTSFEGKGTCVEVAVPERLAYAKPKSLVARFVRLLSIPDGVVS